ncbi:Pol poly [Labeo rohita]|uniref:Pol poly n=1 Tax=Labeo rohita TaxID=84645 RepID=A0A498P1D5_LABRO|nr:Pol poly [Labeo rohita]
MLRITRKENGVWKKYFKWGHIIPVEVQGSSADDKHTKSSKQDDPSTSTFSKLPSQEYVLFTDSELQQVRRTYFEQQRLGKKGDVTLSEELFCRLIQNTMTNMISSARASLDDYKYPTKHEVIAMAKRLVKYYAMIKDKSSGSRHEWDTVAKKLLKRLSNIRSPMKAKQPPSKRAHQDREPSAAVASDYDADSSASTVNLSPPSRSSTPWQENDSADEAYDTRLYLPLKTGDTIQFLLDCL